MSHHEEVEEHRKSPEEVQEDIQQSRREIDETLAELARRLSPEDLVLQALAYLRKGKEAFPLGEAVRRDPIPVVLTGVGIAWLIASGLIAKREYVTGVEGEADYQPEYEEYGEYGGPAANPEAAEEARKKASKAEALGEEASSHWNKGRRRAGRAGRRVKQGMERAGDMAGEHTWALAAAGAALGVAAGLGYWLWSRREPAPERAGASRMEWSQRDWEEREWEEAEEEQAANPYLGTIPEPETEGADTMGAGVADERRDVGLRSSGRAGGAEKQSPGSSSPPGSQKDGAADLRERATYERKGTEGIGGPQRQQGLPIQKTAEREHEPRPRAPEQQKTPPTPGGGSTVGR